MVAFPHNLSKGVILSEIRVFIHFEPKYCYIVGFFLFVVFFFFFFFFFFFKRSYHKLLKLLCYCSCCCGSCHTSSDMQNMGPHPPVYLTLCNPNNKPLKNVPLGKKKKGNTFFDNWKTPVVNCLCLATEWVILDTFQVSRVNPQHGQARPRTFIS